MKVIHIVKTLNEEYGGPARSVQGLVSGLEANGVEAWLVTLEKSIGPWVEGVKHYRNFDGASFREVKSKLRGLIKDVQPDLIQTHDLWMLKLHACHQVARELGIPYIMTPRGALEKWCLRHKWWKKIPALITYQGYDLRNARAIQSTAESETIQTRKYCGSAPVYFSTNGVLFPKELPKRDNECQAKRRALFVSRIHPKKGLSTLVEAWAKVRPKGWEIEIVGTDADGYQRIVEDSVRSLGLENDFIFTGALPDSKKWEAYARADLFILPTHSENFGIVVAEALYAGLPVITTKGTPWTELNTTKSGWCVDDSIDSICQALKEATEMGDEKLTLMGSRGHELICKKYTWSGITKDLVAIYNGFLV